MQAVSKPMKINNGNLFLRSQYQAAKDVLAQKLVACQKQVYSNKTAKLPHGLILQWQKAAHDLIAQALHSAMFPALAQIDLAAIELYEEWGQHIEANPNKHLLTRHYQVACGPEPLIAYYNEIRQFLANNKATALLQRFEQEMELIQAKRNLIGKATVAS